MAGAAGGMIRRLARSFEEWRGAARELIVRRVAPEFVEWLSEPEDGDLFSAAVDDEAGAPPPPSTLRMPRQLMELLESAACFSAPDRWSFLYKVVWRWQLGERDVLSPADPDGSRLHGMVKAVRREEHDMHAYVRFRERKEDDGAP
ncbi:MAG TPA: DUF4130 domain-containing protein, partial [Duganella sp.]